MVAAAVVVPAVAIVLAVAMQNAEVASTSSLKQSLLQNLAVPCCRPLDRAKRIMFHGSCSLIQIAVWKSTKASQLLDA